MRPRVLFLNPFSQEVSGPDESLRSLLSALIPMGIEAHLVLPRPGPQVPRYEALGVKVHYAPLTVLRRRMGPGAFLLPLRILRGAAAVARIARRERIDLIHTNMEVVLDGAVASRLLRVPHVLHYRGNTNDEPRLPFDLLVLLWTATAERILCISNATAEIFRRRRRGEKVEVVYNPVDVEAFASAERSEDLRRVLGAGPGELLVGAVGRVHPRKDLATFLRAAALVAAQRAATRFVVVGGAEAPEELVYLAEMRALAAGLGIADRLVWAGPRPDVPRVMKALDVLVLSSRHEGFGRVAVEAMAAGVPAILTREGALPEIGGAAALFAGPGNAEEFSRQISTALGAPSVRAGLVASGRERATDLSPVRIGRRVASLYGMLLGDAAVARSSS